MSCEDGITPGIKLELAYALAVPQLHMGPRRMKSMYHRDICTPVCHCSTVHDSQGVESTEVSIGGEMCKANVAHIHNRVLFSLKKNEILSFATIGNKGHCVILT